MALGAEDVQHGHSAQTQAADAEEVPAVDAAELVAGILHEWLPFVSVLTSRLRLSRGSQPG